MDYTRGSLKTSFDLMNRESGEIVGEVGMKPVRQIYLTQRGYRRIYMTKDGVYEKFMKSLSSGLEIGVAVDFMRDADKNGVLKYNQSYYAKLHDTSVNTISKIFTKAKKFGLFKSAGRDIYVNPFVVLPYNSDDNNNYFLQRRWEQIWILSDNNNNKVTKNQIDALTIKMRADS